ncbi:uncharacterized protein LOC116415948 [Nasonia vitripennis]|uniref:Uncharacterized protein n=1 Tax=Nasonia vitripennis TaxID=7425 RepID=A0A7M7PV83_NASVI|nr:uncharacterized protein LOC116415948 [Nasonia vitripennis]
MSPASQGALEVERYIGSCLISSTGRAASGLQKPLLASSGCRKQDLQQQQPQSQQLRNSKQQCQQSQFGAVGTWAGGAPLISMASNPRRSQRSPPSQQQQQQQLQQQLNDQRVPLARLAVHTQGAPLILSTGRFHNGGNARAKIPNGAAAIANCVAGLTVGSAGSVSANLARCQPPPRLNKAGSVTTGEQKKPQQQSTGAKDAGGKEATTTNIDSLSIASDESSGSNNSENSLPRIIKPRKRRKKDRKPPPVVSGGSAVVGGVATAAGPNPASDVKTADEGLQQSPSMPGSNAAAIEQQMKPYQAYDGGARYVNGDGYYKGQRRPINANNSGYGRVNNSSASSTTSNSAVNAQSQEVVDTRQRGNNYSQQQQQQQHRHVQVKVLDDNRNVILPVPVCQAKAGYLRHNHHNGGNARFLHDYNEPVTLACHQEHSPPSGGPIDECLQQQQQCRYCDPATLVWDVSEQNGFPYLQGHQSSDFHHHHHHHHHRYSQLPAAVFLTRPFICQEGHHVFDVADNPCQLRLRPAEGLRRSWSDPSSYFSNGEMPGGGELLPNRDVGVIGDRGQSGTESALKGSWRGDASAATPSSQNSSLQSSSSPLSSGPGSPGLQGPLEVSTEIVTSPNGHRDLEIKFYSSSPTTSSYDCSSDELKTFAFPDDEELSDDIWSYHESKLQQDFRTLLQAEE